MTRDLEVSSRQPAAYDKVAPVSIQLHAEREQRPARPARTLRRDNVARTPSHDPQRPPRAAFAEYQATRDPVLRERLVEGHVNMAYAAARRFAGRGEDLEDLKQVALLALVQAVDRFDPSLGLAFSTFATPTIIGTLKRHLRDRNRPVRWL